MPAYPSLAGRKRRSLPSCKFPVDRPRRRLECSVLQTLAGPLAQLAHISVERMCAQGLQQAEGVACRMWAVGFLMQEQLAERSRPKWKTRGVHVGVHSRRRASQSSVPASVTFQYRRSMRRLLEFVENNSHRAAKKKSSCCESFSSVRWACLPEKAGGYNASSLFSVGALP